jgi:hypothetical protein
MKMRKKLHPIVEEETEWIIVPFGKYSTFRVARPESAKVSKKFYPGHRQEVLSVVYPKRDSY